MPTLKKRFNLPFRKNWHVATTCDIGWVNRKIKNYPKQYPTPKYLLFIKKVLEAGWRVKLYEARVSKYVFAFRKGEIYKIRFSNHKPLLSKECADDCDYYVGISHTQVSTTDQIIKKLIT